MSSPGTGSAVAVGVDIGGGIAEAGEPLFRRLREEARLRTMPAMFGQVEIVPAIMGNRSSMIGAAWQVWEYGGRAG